MRTRRVSNSGFTLIELILASVIMAMIGTLTYGALSATFKTYTTVSERSVLQEIGTATLSKIRDDFSQAFVVDSSSKTLTYMRGEDNGNEDRVTFTTLGHLRSGPGAKESDQAQVFYELESDPTETKLFKLKRAEIKYLNPDDKKPDASSYIIIADRVVSFNLEYSNGQSFLPKWDTRSEDSKNALPKAIKVSMKLRDPKEREEDFEALVEIPMSEGLNVVQSFGQGGPGGTPGQSGVPGQAPGQGGGIGNPPVKPPGQGGTQPGHPPRGPGK